VKNFGNILDYNFTAKVEQDFDEIAEGNVDWSVMMKEFYDQFHPTVKMSRLMPNERVENVFLVLIQEQVPVSVRLGKFGPMAQIGDAEDEDKKIC
jgi:DNA topoisomerase-1